MATLLVGIYMMALCASHATTATALTVTVSVHTANSDSCGSGAGSCAGTISDVTVAYKVDGSFTSPSTLCHGAENCDNDLTASLSLSLTEMPTTMKWHMLGDNAWLFDSVSLDVDGKTCTLLSSGPHAWYQGNCLDGDAGCGSEKTFDLQSLCPSLFLKVSVTVHTANSDSCGSGAGSCAGTISDVTVAYKVAGSFTSPHTLCHGAEDCDNDLTASSSTTLTEMPTEMKWHMLGDNAWLFDSVSLDVDGKTCTLLSSGPHAWYQGNCLDGDYGCGSEKTFDLQSSCPGLFATPPQSGLFATPPTSSVSSVTFPIFIAALSSATAVALAVHNAVLHRRIADLKHGSLLLG